MADKDNNTRVRERLDRLKDRLAEGEITSAEYEKSRDLLVGDLSVEEREKLGLTPTPRPATPGPRKLGPSGSVGTKLDTVAEFDLKPGSMLFDQWRIGEELGRGGFGAVFAAEDVHLGEIHAVKVLDPKMVAREELLARFRREVALMRRLIHPRIVRVYDYREDVKQSLALISMELVRGCSVRQLLAVAAREQAQVPVELALRILAQALEAIAEGHAKGVIHRDVTPGNILIAGGTAEQLLGEPGRDPEVKLVDFGIAGLVEKSELSQKSQALGTLGYAPPELLDPNAEVTPAADVYSAGAVAYQLLTGELPTGRFPDPSEVRAELGREVDELLLQILARQATMRPAVGDAASRAARLADEARRTRASAGAEALAREAEKRESAARAQWLTETLRQAIGASDLEGAKRTIVELERLALPDNAALLADAGAWLSNAEAARERDTRLHELLAGIDESLRKNDLAGAEVAIGAARAMLRGTGADEQSLAARVESLEGMKRRAEEERGRSVVLRTSWNAPGFRVAEKGVKWYPSRLGPEQEAEAERLKVPVAIEHETTGMVLVLIPGGEFLMGASAGDGEVLEDEKPLHRVRLEPYYVATTPVTQEQWERVMGKNPSRFKGAVRPVETVNWNDTQEFLKKLPGSGLRLPAEAEWECAARSGTTSRYWWGDQYVKGQANTDESEFGGACLKETTEIGKYAANAWGLWDVLGNVWEWCADWYGGDYYSQSPSINPRGPSSGTARVLRGGSWFNYPRRLRVSFRYRYVPDYRIVYFGFRCGRDVIS